MLVGGGALPAAPGRPVLVEPGSVAVDRPAHRRQGEAGRARNLLVYPLHGLCNPEEVAEAVAFLSGSAASYVNSRGGQAG
ncbi:hypothetical protein [Kitasatospora sp. GP82]|uniref:hypothetical protein n=1 Tax=Kitasatospora sp. GP82 TaxID=3035089 RepID=UPI002474F1DA|nr:hypothetical protein [Kitasatospora sp. GP82]MDH6124776.1 NAD(P)-dependent dehydrogenase (short-subunit alcohol dehydrogenase family) [Kitasatospora sp. GP82]